MQEILGFVYFTNEQKNNLNSLLLIYFSFSFESDVAAISGEATDRIAVVRVGEQKKWPTYLQFY